MPPVGLGPALSSRLGGSRKAKRDRDAEYDDDGDDIEPQPAKEQFKLKEHINRLYTGLKILRIPLEMTPEEMEHACYQTIEANEHLFDDDDEHSDIDDIPD